MKKILFWQQIRKPFTVLIVSKMLNPTLQFYMKQESGKLTIMKKMANAVSSRYIWSENSHPKSEAKDGGN
jgi:hypothetical protein